MLHLRYVGRQVRNAASVVVQGGLPRLAAFAKTRLGVFLGVGCGLAWATACFTTTYPSAVVKGGLVLVSSSQSQAAQLALGLSEGQTRLDLAKRQCAAFHQTALDRLEQAPTMPAFDIDTLSSTDLEDLFTFACDLFEFLYQEHALFCAAFGYGTGARIATGAALGVYALKRIIASQRHKN